MCEVLFLSDLWYGSAMNTYHFSIIIERDEHGYFVRCPDLQGCYSQGETYEEAMQNINDAIKLHLQDRLVGQEDIPKLQSISFGTVEVAA